MEKKKTPKADLERKKSLFIQIGLIVALCVTIFAFEYKSYDTEEVEVIDRTAVEVVEEVVLQTKAEEPPPPPEDVPQQESTELEIVDDSQELTNEVKISSFTEDRGNVRVEVPKVVVVEETLEEEEEIFVVVEQQATYPGGDAARMKFLQENIKYPQAAREGNVQGTVWVTFVVEKDGSLTDIKVLRDIGGGCGEEAIRVVKAMPKWTPAQQRGKKVRHQFNLPIKFTLAG